MASYARKNWYGTWGKGGNKKKTCGEVPNPNVDAGGNLTVRDRSKSVSSHDLSSRVKEEIDDSQLPDNETNQRHSEASLPNQDDHEQKILRYQKEAKRKLEELVSTERSYIKDLEEMHAYIVYLERSKRGEKGIAPIPKDLKKGKDRIVFANIQALREFHLKILPDIEKCVEKPSELPKIFSRHKDAMKKRYGMFCINKPKSDYIQSEYEDFFSLVRMALKLYKPLSSLLMTPVQRVTRYQLLIKDIKTYFGKANDEENLALMQNAYDEAHEICEYANDMMTAGRIEGLPDDLEVTRQGLLLRKEETQCYKRNHGLLRRPNRRQCIVFIFKESIIICEKIPPPASRFPPQLIFWAVFQINKMTLRDCIRDQDFGESFELVKKEDSKDQKIHRKPSKAGQRKASESTKEVINVIVKCKDGDTKNDLVTLINDQIKKLSELQDTLSNPMGKASPSPH